MKKKQAGKLLLQAVLEPRRPGALKQIEDACEAGADPNAVVAETSTSRGHVPGGRTLLTHSVHEEASKAVARLLVCGADPNLEDALGWTPWMASTVIDESKRQRIQADLIEHGATQQGDYIGQLARAIADGDVDGAKALATSDRDFEILTSFRVDLVARQVPGGNPKMLQWLLERGMQASSTVLHNAVRFNDATAVDILLRHGMPPETPRDSETLLMVAAGLGNREIVERLIEAGANPSRYADDDPEHTASFFARRAGHTELADWLLKQINDDVVVEQGSLAAGRKPKFRLLYEQGTASETQSTEDIVSVLSRWDQNFDIEITDAAPDSVSVKFSALPDDVDALIDEIVEFCPDVAEDTGELRQQLKSEQTLQLWWD